MRSARSVRSARSDLSTFPFFRTVAAFRAFKTIGALRAGAPERVRVVPAPRVRRFSSVFSAGFC
ncbi:MAG: hypothetical protein ACLUHG_01885 [Sutterella wadsworthensis]